jgi:fumarylacetoacetase
VPLGPFNAKGFATTISPWIVTLDALEPFRTATPKQEPEPLQYLRHAGNHAFDIELEVHLRPALAESATKLSRTNFKLMYWSMAQQLAHHTVAGCNTRVGDLMGSGTISGPTPDSCGSLLEMTWNGERPITLEEGGERRFIEDGDELTLTGWCQGEGYRVGFGECKGVVLPARGVAE